MSTCVWKHNVFTNGKVSSASAECFISRRLNPLSISAWQVNSEISLHLSVEGKVLYCYVVLSGGFSVACAAFT